MTKVQQRLAGNLARTLASRSVDSGAGANHFDLMSIAGYCVGERKLLTFKMQVTNANPHVQPNRYSWFLRRVPAPGPTIQGKAGS